MTGKQTRQGGLIWHGWVPDTDPIYRTGWNFIGRSSLNRPSGEPSSEQKREAPPELHRKPASKE
jgi:hypothetical protein